VAGLVVYFRYGSSHDGDVLKVDMCDEVAEDVLKLEAYESRRDG
jgi:hypothetical protein